MLLSDSLEVAIGLVFVFTLFSMVLTSCNELIETRLKSRSAKLYDGIVDLFAEEDADAAATGRAAEDGRAAAEQLYRHPLVRGLMKGSVASASASRRTGRLTTAELPSYIPSRNFALALIGEALAGRFADPRPDATLPVYAPPVEQLRFAAERIANAQVRGLLLQATSIAGDSLDTVRAHLEGVYNGAMDRVSGKYKRRTQKIIFALGLLAAVALNINTLEIADSLSQDATLRRAVVAQASVANTDADAQQAIAAIRATGLPVGWDAARWQATATLVSDSPFHVGLLQVLFGFLLTAFAGSLGAPFWFDLLNRLMVIRATVKPTEKSRDEAPQDPQPPRPATSTVVVVRPDEKPSDTPAAIPPPIDRHVYADGAGDDMGMWEDDGGNAVDAVPAPEMPDPAAQGDAATVAAASRP